MFGAGSPRRCGGIADPGQRRAQVALDVVGQRLERRDVEDADRARRARGSASGCRVGGEPIERPQEGGECLAAAGRGVDQRVLAGGDRRPAARLGLGRGLEARLEPVADGARERRQGSAPPVAAWSRSRDEEYRPRRPFRPDVLSLDDRALGYRLTGPSRPAAGPGLPSSPPRSRAASSAACRSRSVSRCRRSCAEWSA